jgi:hypothetical protein
MTRSACRISCVGATVVLSLVLASAESTAQRARRVARAVYLPNCSKSLYGGESAPTRWSFGCTTLYQLTQLHWHQWGSAQAWATGLSNSDDCTPDCATGRIRSLPTKVVAWGITSCRGGPDWRTARYYTHLASGPPSLNLSALMRKRYEAVSIECLPPTPARSLLLRAVGSTNPRKGFLAIGAKRLHTNDSIQQIVATIGRPDSCDSFVPSGFAGNRALTWNVGIEISFYSTAVYSSSDRNWRDCIAGAQPYPFPVIIFQRNRWRTPIGLHVGDTVTRFRTLCPHPPAPVVIPNSPPTYETCDQKPAFGFTLDDGTRGRIDRLLFVLNDLNFSFHS